MKFAIYGRKSVYTGRGESIENQIEMCKQYVFSKFPASSEADIAIYEDEGFSAKNADRPQFRQMLLDLRRDSFDFVVCYRLDRISRNVSDFSALIEDLNNRDVSFICVREEFDTSKPMGRAMMYIASVFAQLERETIAERVRDNMLMLARTGRWLGGTTPTGFTSERTREVVIDGRIKASHKLKADPAEIAVIKTIFEKFLELRGVSGVSKYLISQNIKSRSGKIYSLPGLRDILRNPVYCVADRDALQYFTKRNADVCFGERDCSDRLGLLSYNKRDYTKKHAVRQPVEKWIIAIGRHKGIIPGKKWVDVQNILESGRKPGSNPSNTRNGYSLLSGFIYCGKCGSRMFAKTRSNNPERFDYICNGKMRGGIALCDCRNIGGLETDSTVFEYLLQYQKESPVIYKLLERLKKNLRKLSEGDPLESVNARVKKCDDELDRLVLAMSQGNHSLSFMERLNARITELDEKRGKLAEEQSRLQRHDELTDSGKTRLNMLAGDLSGLRESFHELDVLEKRDLIKLLAEKIVWDGQDLHVFINV